MKKKEYKFNPESYGYKHVSNFPELQYLFGNTTYIKVTANGGKKHFGRTIYWYSACYNLGHDDRWKFLSSSYDSNRPNEINSSGMRQTYMGLISTDSFAKDLLCHIMGTTQNKSVYTTGLERLNEDIKVDY